MDATAPAPRIVVSDLRKAVEDKQRAKQEEWRLAAEKEVARVQQTVLQKFREDPRLEHTFTFKFTETYHAGDERIKSAVEAMFDESVQVAVRNTHDDDKLVTVKVA